VNGSKAAACAEFDTDFVFQIGEVFLHKLRHHNSSIIDTGGRLRVQSLLNVEPLEVEVFFEALLNRKLVSRPMIHPI